MTSYITGLAGGPTGYFVDNNGQPKLWVAGETWGLAVNAGNWGVANYQATFDNYFATRAAQGFTVIMLDPAWSEVNAANTSYNGNDWDGTTPLTSGTDPSATTLNSAFWTRIDYMFTSAASHGITIGLVLYDEDGVGNASSIQHGWGTTQWTAWANKIATRYASTPNLIWLIGNDSFSPFSDTNWGAITTGLSNAGDTHLFGVWYNPECTSRYVTDTGATEDFGIAHSSFNFCYSYNASYWIIEYAYGEVANEGASALLPVIHGDGFFYNGGTGPYGTTDRFERQLWWWVLASGGRGVIGESEAVYPWTSTAQASAQNEWFFANNAANIASCVQGLPNWHKLMPDLSSSFVTAGRGTRVAGLASGGSATQYSGFSNSYVAASITADGSLALAYLPNATTITIDPTKLAAGYTPYWVDPVTGTKTATAPSTTYNSTAKGTNSQGDPDWVLAFVGPQASTQTRNGPTVARIGGRAGQSDIYRWQR